ncbi:MAG: hypothetical protein HQ567_04785 [Candidatus Nealsonbacteria bacterium]|nr:hypothetical protein [Candidatus Nealsonbacteria bacterium]
MNRRFSLICVSLAVAVATLAVRVPAAEPAASKTPQAWTYEEAAEQLRFNPEDVYLQYVTLQLGRNAGKAKEAADLIQSVNRRRWRGLDPNRQVDLFAMFTGALAVQEALQLDTMRGEGNESLRVNYDPARDVVRMADLEGPTVKSHPWGKMLAAQTIAGRKPKVSPLAMCVPEDQYYVVFGSLTKLLEGIDVGDLWGVHVLKQATKSARTQQSSKRMKTQLAIKTNALVRPFYDMVVDEVAITGSDLYFREGSDVTMLFAIKQPEVFRLRMDGFLADAQKWRDDAVRSTGKIEGVEYVQVATPDREIHVFSAYPTEKLHVRSNSKAGLARVLRAIAGKGDIGRLGEATEFKYIRTLMVRGDEREDGFVYLSDAFIRRLVGPELKVTELRRMLCYNHQRMIGHATMLYRTQFGKSPESLEQLADAKCAPGVFGREKFRCPCGGKYSLSADGATSVCSHHGRADRLIPCLEIPLERVTEAEAKEYRQFVTAYSRYWRRFFDPIAVRVQLTPERYRAETIILPLIDNTIYSSLATVLGGEPEPLDALPVPERNIFSMSLRLNKEALLAQSKMLDEAVGDLTYDLGRGNVKPPSGEAVRQFLTRGIGNQIGMHVYDASPFFDFNLTEFLGEMMGQFRGVDRLDDELIPISFLVASLNAPVYISVPVKDAKIVDGFLDELDTVFAEVARRNQDSWWFDFDFDFYRVPLADKDPRIRCFCVEIGPIKWRLFFARIGDGLYIASKRFILEDLAAIEKKPADTGPVAHGMVRIRADHWEKVLPAFELGWAESSRVACLNNLGPLSSISRAVRASGQGAVSSKELNEATDRLHAVHFFCPDGGRYVVSPDGKDVSCTMHGTAAAPRQLVAPAKGSAMDRLMKDFSGLTAQLIFLEDGLHAVVTVDRK